MAEQATKQKRRFEGKPVSEKRNKKGKGKFKPKAPVGPKSIVPASLYVCDCHDEIATKEPCLHKEKDKAEHKRSQSTLGSWRCAVTKKKAKVRRRSNSEGQAVNV